MSFDSIGVSFRTHRTGRKMKLNIRLVHKSELSQLLQLRSRYLREVRSTAPKSCSMFRRKLFSADRKSRCLVASYRSKIVAYALFQNFYDMDAEKDGYFLSNIFVDRRYRRRGVGTQLLDQLRRVAARDGKSFVWWLSAQSNPNDTFYSTIAEQQSDARTYAIIVEREADASAPMRKRAPASNKVRARS
jgi:GNAT superfamily N-acetyltransferase